MKKKVNTLTIRQFIGSVRLLQRYFVQPSGLPIKLF